MGQVFETCCLETTDQMSPIRASDPPDTAGSLPPSDTYTQKGWAPHSTQSLPAPKGSTGVKPGQVDNVYESSVGNTQCFLTRRRRYMASSAVTCRFQENAKRNPGQTKSRIVYIVYMPLFVFASRCHFTPWRSPHAHS
jgi:hypothetical protein